MFSNCTSLSDVTIGESVTSIDNSAFSDCYSLESITIPNGVTVIGGRAFSDCSSLTAVTIPYHVTNIEEFAFDGCSSLLSVVIPNSVTNIWMGAFQSCNQLTDVYYVGTEANWGEIKIEWFNSFLQNATKHYIAPDAVSLGALKYARVSGGFTVQSTLYTPVPATAYFVLYNNLGRFLGVEARTLDAGSAETMTFFVPSGARFAKLMLLDAASAPLCANAEAFLPSGSAGGGDPAE